MRRFRYQEQWEHWQLARMYHPVSGAARDSRVFRAESGRVSEGLCDTRPQELRDIVALGYLSGEYVETSDGDGFVIWFDCADGAGFPKMPVTFVTHQVVNKQ